MSAPTQDSLAHRAQKRPGTRGTTTSTDTRVFAEIPVFETTEREFLTQGNARVAVPANLMHTFEAGHNKVVWRLKVHGEIPRWPDVADDYPIVVLPLPLLV